LFKFANEIDDGLRIVIKQTMALVSCEKCGHKISEHATVCPKCKSNGEAPLDKVTLENTTIPKDEVKKASTTKKSQVTPPTNNSKKKNRKKGLIIGGISVVILLYLITYVVSIGLNSDISNSPGTHRDGEINSNGNDQSQNNSGTNNEPSTNSSSRQKTNNAPERPVEQGPSPEEVRKNMYRENLGSYVTLDVNDYKQKLLGGIKNLQVTITNRLEYSINSAVVKVDYYRMNDKLYTTRYVQFSTINANHRLTRAAPETEFGTYVRCSIKSVDIPELNQ
jgi:ribosomal protein L40E